MHLNELEKVEGLATALPFDVTEENSSYLIVGNRGGYARVSPSARFLLRWAQAGRTFDELAKELRLRKGQDISPETLETAYGRLIGSLEEIDQRAGAGRLPTSYWLRLQIFSKELVSTIAPLFSVLFHPLSFWMFVLAAVATTTYAVRNNFSLAPGAVDFWSAYGLFVLSLIFHEFGHASACARFGAQPSGIGFVMYLIFPAFYSDVTNAWRLDRAQRVVVDLGGNYFQYVVGLAYVVIFLLTGKEDFRLAFVMIVYSSAFSLNPIFKFDGYWVLADSLGVMNLSQQPRRILSGLPSAIKSFPRNPFPWPRWVAATLVLYSLAAIAFWVFCVGRLAPWIWTETLAYPSIVIETLEVMTSPGNHPNWGALLPLVTATAILVVVYTVAFRFLGAAFDLLRSKMRNA